MSNLKIREQKIQEKRKNTTRRDFLKEILSYYSFSLYKKNDGKVTAFSPKYSFNTVDPVEFDDSRDSLVEL